MFNSKERKSIRKIGIDKISTRQYNAILGGTLLYGFLVNILLVFVARNFFMQMNPIIFLVGYFIAVIAGSIVVSVSSNPAISFLGYNLICVPIGAVLAICVPEYPIDMIIAAIGTTAFVTVMMIGLGTIFKNFFSKIGTALIAGLFIGFIAELIAILCGYGGDLFNWFFVILFSMYIGYDWYKAQSYTKTVDNAIDSAVDLYLDIINLFIRLLSILGKKK